MMLWMRLIFLSLKRVSYPILPSYLKTKPFLQEIKILNYYSHKIISIPYHKTKIPATLPIGWIGSTTQICFEGLMTTITNKQKKPLKYMKIFYITI